MNSYHTNAKGSNKKTRVGWPRMNFTQKHVNKNKKKKKKKKNKIKQSLVGSNLCHP